MVMFAAVLTDALLPGAEPPAAIPPPLNYE